MILSVSRRTDIPAFFSEWFMERLRQGHVFTRNPMNHSQIKKIELNPVDISCIVFWTKDAKNMIQHIPELDGMGYSYYFNFTLTPYDKNVEKGLRDKAEIEKDFIRLSKIIGSNRMIWRYDPIILNDYLTLSYHETEFERLCKTLSGYTTRCIISFVDYYTKLKKIADKGFIREISADEMKLIASAFSNIAKKYAIELFTCCEDVDLAEYSIRNASCIDKSLIESITGEKLLAKPDRNQRKGCGCVSSVDIGKYNTCANDCIYCYANFSKPAILNNLNRYDVKSPLLCDFL